MPLQVNASYPVAAEHEYVPLPSVAGRFPESTSNEPHFFDCTTYYPERYPPGFSDVCANPSVPPAVVNQMHEHYLRIKQDFEFLGESAIDRTAFTAPPIKSWAPGADDRVGHLLKDSEVLFNVLATGKPMLRRGVLGCAGMQDHSSGILGRRSLR